MLRQRILKGKLFMSSQQKPKETLDRFFIELVTKTTITNKQLTEMLKGATIVVYNDNYSFYDKINTSCSSKIGKHSKKLVNKLKTSHDDVKGQYRCNKSKIKMIYLNSKQLLDFDILVGKGNSKLDKPSTWFQMEKNSINSGNIISHGIDFIKHKLYNINIGPIGTSQFTESNPIIVKLKKSKSKSKSN